jgi:hypothetical protein
VSKKSNNTITKIILGMVLSCYGLFFVAVYFKNILFSKLVFVLLALLFIFSGLWTLISGEIVYISTGELTGWVENFNETFINKKIVNKTKLIWAGMYILIGLVLMYIFLIKYSFFNFGT